MKLGTFKDFIKGWKNATDYRVTDPSCPESAKLQMEMDALNDMADAMKHNRDKDFEFANARFNIISSADLDKFTELFWKE